MSLVAEVIFSGFVSKAINNCVDVSWDKIAKAVKNKNNKHQSLESQIYNVTVDVLNKLTNNLYKDNQSIIYDAAESLLQLFRESSITELENLISCLKKHFSYVDKNKCMDFKRLLYEELGKNEYSELFHTILLLLLDQKNQYDREVIEQLNQKFDQVILILNQKEDDDKDNNTSNVSQTVKSRTQEYADKWDENMFLNDFDEWDENAGVNVKLSDVYIEDHLPHFIWGQNKKKSKNLSEFLSKYIDNKFDNKMLLILGQPGIGKSTLITWITANFSDRIDDIMVYKFAADLKDMDWQSFNLANRVLDALNLSYNDLDGKTLILDGFDEISVGDKKEILDKIYWELIKERNVRRFSIIITCRENYISNFERIQCEYITLLPWNEEQIRSFCKYFQEKTNDIISEHTIAKVIENRQILGIPLILYMVLALNIAIEKEGSIVDIYDKIFSLDGGIYDRCIDNKNFANIHRISEIKEQIHQVSREIAIWMFENEPNETYIPQTEYEKICNSVMKGQERNGQEIKRDILIGNYFKLMKHCEGGGEGIYFVHRSIYEYFVAETIYNSIKDAMLELSEDSKKELAGKIAVYLKKGRITTTIGEYLQYMILQLYHSLNGEKQERFYLWWESTVDMMMSHGMFYYTGKNIQFYEKIIEKETNCFVNLLKILRSLFELSNQSYIFENIKSDQLEKYIMLRLMDCKWELFYGTERFNLSRLFLHEIDFENANLTLTYLAKTCLTNANLNNANLRHVVLIGANMADADLRDADLRDANLRYTDLRNADLRNADLRNADLINANLEGADLEGANVYSAHWIEANLEKSIWHKYDICNVYLQLKEAKFDILLIRDSDGVKQVSRNELFPDENISSNV